MKNLIIVLSALMVSTACSKNESDYFVKSTSVEKQKKVMQMKGFLPNELIIETLPHPISETIITCHPNPYDCGPWIIVKASKSAAYSAFKNAVSANTIRSYFQNDEYLTLFDVLDISIVNALKNGEYTISELPSAPNTNVFIVHASNSDGVIENAVIGLPFELTDEN